MIDHEAQASGREDADHVGGVLNIFGVRPGRALNYEGKAMTSVIHFDIQFETTYEAIERVVLPAPLLVDRTLPPIVNLSYFTNAEVRGFDGRNVPYVGVMFTAATQWGDYRGVAGWEFVDGIRGDKTEMDIMGPWGLQFGMLKKFADITASHTAADTFTVEVKRRGKILVRFALKTGALFDAAELADVNQASQGVFGVRDIPNVDYSGYSERTVVWTDPNKDHRVSRAWHAQPQFLEFGSGELDPLTELQVSKLTSAFAYDSSSLKEHFATRRVIGDLLALEHRGAEEDIVALSLGKALLPS